jgi:hypothetical protein
MLQRRHLDLPHTVTSRYHRCHEALLFLHGQTLRLVDLGKGRLVPGSRQCHRGRGGRHRPGLPYHPRHLMIISHSSFPHPSPRANAARPKATNRRPCRQCVRVYVRAQVGAFIRQIQL